MMSVSQSFITKPFFKVTLFRTKKLMKVLCRCSCSQSSFKSTGTKLNTHSFLYLINKKTPIIIILKVILKDKTEVSILLQLLCRCSCTQSGFKSSGTKSSTHSILYLINKSTLIILKRISKDKTEVIILLQEGSCSACRLVKCQVSGPVSCKINPGMMPTFFIWDIYIGFINNC